MTTSASLGDFTISRQPDLLDDAEVLDSQAAGPTKQRAIRLGPRMASVCLSVYMRSHGNSALWYCACPLSFKDTGGRSTFACPCCGRLFYVYVEAPCQLSHCRSSGTSLHRDDLMSAV